MVRKVISIIMIISIVTCFVSIVDASILDQIIEHGNKLDADKSTSETDIGNVISGFLTGQIIPIIGAIGNLIFAIVTVVLGLKYIWSSAEGKAEVQESLPAFVIAVVFFYLAGTIFDTVSSASVTVSGSGNWENLSNNLWWIISTVVKYAALAGIVFIGIKYMLASAEGRASMKTSLGGAVIGLLLVFMATNIVTFITQAAGEIL